MRTREEVVKAFTPVEGKFLTETQKIVLEKINVEFRELATFIIADVPECPDRTAALRKLLECKMTCTQAVTHTGYQKAEEKPHGNKETQTKTAHQKAV